MAHKKKDHLSNSRKDFRWRVNHNQMTDEDKKRIETKIQASQTSKHSNPYVMHKHQNSKSDFLRAR